jgi:hypothetical protein
VGYDREGFTMTELTPREILEAIRRGLEETARRFTDRKPDEMKKHPQPSPPNENVKDQGRGR